jgi:hypothetical protein
MPEARRVRGPVLLLLLAAFIGIVALVILLSRH